MDTENRCRQELKYFISDSAYLATRARLREIMRVDPYTTANGTYLIRSIYFDNCDDKALREKTDGLGKREKFRLRYYNNDFSYIKLEKKLKLDSCCKKETVRITESEFKRLLQGDLMWMRSHPQDLVMELYAKMHYQQLRPRVMVSYIREPYAYPAGDVRVTFDSCIRTSLFHRDFLSESIPEISVADVPYGRIMEVKYSAFLPEVIRAILQTNGADRQAVSKYGAARYFG